MKDGNMQILFLAKREREKKNAVQGFKSGNQIAGAYKTLMWPFINSNPTAYLLGICNLTNYRMEVHITKCILKYQ